MLTKIRRQEQKNILNLFPLKKAILVTWIRFFLFFFKYCLSAEETGGIFKHECNFFTSLKIPGLMALKLKSNWADKGCRLGRFPSEHPEAADMSFTERWLITSRPTQRYSYGSWLSASCCQNPDTIQENGSWVGNTTKSALYFIVLKQSAFWDPAVSWQWLLYKYPFIAL